MHTYYTYIHAHIRTVYNFKAHKCNIIIWMNNLYNDVKVCTYSTSLNVRFAIPYFTQACYIQYMYVYIYIYIVLYCMTGSTVLCVHGDQYPTYLQWLQMLLINYIHTHAHYKPIAHGSSSLLQYMYSSCIQYCSTINSKSCAHASSYEWTVHSPLSILWVSSIL